MSKAKAAAKKSSEESTEEVKTSSKKMTKEQAQAVVDRYSGINGANVPDELKQARAVLKGE